MDYTYIEQLLERYWECNTTLQEEYILRTFFSQEDIPEHLQRYKAIFDASENLNKEHLEKDFDERIMSLIHSEDYTEESEKTTRAKKMTFFRGFMPLYKAAAMVAIVLSIGMAAQHSFVDDSTAPSDSGQMAEDPDAEYTVLPSGTENTSAEATTNDIEDSLKTEQDKQMKQ